MILVTGATGTVGRELVRRFPSGLRVRLMTRDPARVTGMPVTVETVAADHGDPQSLARALAGVGTAFLVTNRIAGDDDARFVRAASKAGVRRLVKLSAAAVLDPDADDLITRWQRANEELLRASGMEWTLLRPRAFMSNSLSWVPSIRSERVVRTLHGTSANACVDPRDIAEVAVRVLTEEEHAGKAYTLTGPEAITAAEQTDQLGRLLGIPLRFEELTPDEARDGLAKRWPAPVVQALLESAERQRSGAKAGVDDTVRAVTGRRAGTFGAWARDHLAAFTPDLAAGRPRVPGRARYGGGA
ncbi:NAD(P)H-binding protein [Streptomyces sp. NBC_01361]|uniref:NAD(P)H-binding protein n=1 Tax=Streptomyces sp. NBC_01361 TaxID=2903838 RepID=UPI002E330696|nr:NAD(P)H-binding protein [Streptomyces sp. NBC_01361]